MAPCLGGFQYYDEWHRRTRPRHRIFGRPGNVGLFRAALSGALASWAWQDANARPGVDGHAFGPGIVYCPDAGSAVRAAEATRDGGDRVAVAVLDLAPLAGGLPPSACRQIHDLDAGTFIVALRAAAIGGPCGADAAVAIDRCRPYPDALSEHELVNAVSALLNEWMATQAQPTGGAPAQGGEAARPAHGRYFAELERHSRQLDLLMHHAQLVTSHRALDQVLACVVDGAVAVTQASAGVISELSPDGRELRPLAVAGDPRSQGMIGRPFPVDGSLTGWAVTSQQPMIFPDASAYASANSAPGHPFHGFHMLAVPLGARDHGLGALVLLRSGRPFDEHDLSLAATFAGYAATAIEHTRVSAEARCRSDEREAVLEALRRSEDRLAVILGASSDGFWDWDVARDVVFHSPRYYEMLGYDPESGPLTLRRWVKLMHPDDRASFFQRYRALIRGNDTFEASFRFRSRAGGYCSAMSRGRVVTRDANGAPARIVGVHVDVTERERMMWELAQSEERFRMLFQHSPDAHFIHDMDGTIVEVNEAAVRITGGSRDDLVGRNMSELTDNLDAQSRFVHRGMAAEDLKRLLQRHEQVVHARDGRTMIVEAQAHIITIGGQDYVLGRVRDITEQKRSERFLGALNRADAAMEHATTQAEIFEVVAAELKTVGCVCVYITPSDDGGLAYVRHHSFGDDMERVNDLLGRSLHEVGLLAPDVPHYASVLQGESLFLEDAADTISGLLSPEMKASSAKIAEMLHARRMIMAPLIARNELEGVLAVLSDELRADDMPAVTAFANQMAAAWRKAKVVADLHESVRELRDTQARLVQSQKMDAIGRLAGGVAHDFNNLLTVINGYSEHILSTLPPSSALAEDVREIACAGAKAADLTRQLLAFSRQSVAQVGPLDMNAVIQSMTKMLGRLIGEDVRLHLDLADGLDTVVADRTQMEQVLINLAVNARDAMPAGGTLTVRTCAVTMDADSVTSRGGALDDGDRGRDDILYVCAIVSDTGTGMGPDVSTRVFEPFFTTKSADRGTGLGLSTVYGIIEQSGGFIDVESAPGLGTAFTVFLRAKPHTPPARNSSAGVRDLPTGTERILVVEDEAGVRQIATDVLKRLGYDVVSASSGQEALRLWEQMHGFDLVLTDVVMPGMDGKALYAELKRRDPSTRVAYMSGYPDDTLGRRGVLRPGIRLIQKPFVMSDLARQVREALDDPI